MHKRTKIAQALKALNEKINNGAEFPDVIGRIARNFKVTERELTQAYDAQ